MFFHYKGLQFESTPERPDPVFAMKLQELLGGHWGEMTVAMQYLMQGWNCRIPGKYKDLLLETGTEELAHVEMISNMIAKLLEGAPAEETARACEDNPMLAAIVGGQNPQHSIVSGGGAVLADAAGTPWSGKWIVASGNLLADFRVNAAAEGQSKLQAARVYNMTDDPGVKNMLKFNLARDSMHQNQWLAAIESRDSMHQNQWLAAIEELKDDGLEYDPVPAGIIDEEYHEYSGQLWGCSDGDSSQGRWAHGPRPDGRGEFSYLDRPGPLAGEPTPPSADPYLYATVPGGPDGQRPDGTRNGSRDGAAHTSGRA